MKTTKKILAFVLSAIMMLSMVTIASAAETKTISAGGAARYSVSNVLSHSTESWEEDGETYIDEVFECAAPAVVTVSIDTTWFEIIDNTYYDAVTESVENCGFIMPDGCTNEADYWEKDLSSNVPTGTTYTLTAPGLYTLCVGLGTYSDVNVDGEVVEAEDTIYATINIAGERAQNPANFTANNYYERIENSATTDVSANENVFGSDLMDISNIVEQDGDITLVNRESGESVTVPVYSCLAPVVATATTALETFILGQVGENDGIYYIGMPYEADNEETDFYDRLEKGTPTGTKYTATSPEYMYYVAAIKDGKESAAVLRLDGVQPININKGKSTETLNFWSEIPNGSATINGVYDITYDEWGEEVYVIDKNSTITYNSYLSDYINVYSEAKAMAEQELFLESDVCTPVMYDTISYLDNSIIYDNDSEQVPTTQVKPGMTVKFNYLGYNVIQVSPGYASRDERISIQDNEDTLYGWQWSPAISVMVIDPAPWATYTSSKVIVDGKIVEFEAYNINGNNYFKLRDVAMAISGTEKDFAVNWDDQKRAISLYTMFSYNPVGGELAKGDGTSKAAVMSTASVYVDQKPVKFSAYNINGNNYFKLRDLGETFDFDVSWDGANNCITIDTASSYTAD